MALQNRIRKLLSEGKTVTGMLLFTGSPMVVEMMAATGLISSSSTWSTARSISTAPRI
jgi:hypothetical protein